MESNTAVKADITELVKAYGIVTAVVADLREDGLLNPHDCDNILGQLKSGMIEDILMYTRSHLAQPLEKNALKTMRDYKAVKAVLEKQNLTPDEMKEIMGLFFKK